MFALEQAEREPYFKHVPRAFSGVGCGKGYPKRTEKEIAFH